jgi:hypothetical protein
MKWSTYFGSSNYCMGLGMNPCDVATLPNGDVILSGYSSLSTPSTGELNTVYHAPGAYNQQYNASNSFYNPGSLYADTNPVDGWIAQFDGSNNKKWITNFGGAQKVNQGVSSDPIAQEQLTAICIGGSGNNLTLFATGVTRCAFTPVINNGGYFQGRYNANNDIFIARFGGVRNVGIDETEGLLTSEQLQVSPNPSTGSFQVSYYAKEPGSREARVSVVNLMGQVVQQQLVALQAGIGKFEVVLQDMPSGIYMLHVDGDAAAKLIKQ